MNLNQMNEIEKMANVHEEVNKVVKKVKNDGLINDQGKVVNQTTQANVENIQKVFDT
jgi:glycerol-3-phosphate responsive antiterminator